MQVLLKVSLQLIQMYVGLARGWCRCYSGLFFQGFFKEGCLGFFLGWFRAYVGRVSGFFKVGLVIDFWLVQGWFRLYVDLICVFLGFASDSFGCCFVFV